MSPKPKKPTWSQLSKVLNRCESQVLVELIRDIYDASPENRLFLQTKVLSSADIDSVLPPYRERIIRQFFPSRGYGKLDLMASRAAIREFKKATGSVAGTIELMLTYVENGTSFTLQYGDITSAFYSSLTSVYGEMANLFYKEGRELYPRFREGIQKLAEYSSRIGWGYGDFLNEQAFELDAELLDEQGLEAE